jgi:SAM-dependent methyltransferase
MHPFRGHFWRKNMIILDIGCGKNKYKSTSPDDVVIGLDSRKNTAADIVCDIEKGLPFAESSIDKVVTFHALEHLRDLVGVMEEIWRVSKLGSEVWINVPYWVASGAHSDPTHVRFFTYNTFDYFEPDFYYDHYSNAQFRIKSKRIMFVGDSLPEKYKRIKALGGFLTYLINISPMLYQSTFLVYLCPAKEIYYRLECVK